MGRRPKTKRSLRSKERAATHARSVRFYGRGYREGSGLWSIRELEIGSRAGTGCMCFPNYL